MKKTIVFITFLISGCATGINSMQHQELLGYEAKGLAIQEKSTATATALGILPGGGSFYTRNYGFGVVNLLLWPFSVLWDPVSGYNGAEEINYHATVANANKQKDTEISNLDTLLMTQQLDNTQYILKKRQVEQKYSPTGSVTSSNLLPTPNK
jgi:hypothetical protein